MPLCFALGQYALRYQRVDVTTPAVQEEVFVKLGQLDNQDGAAGLVLAVILRGNLFRGCQHLFALFQVLIESAHIIFLTYMRNHYGLYAVRYRTIIISQLLSVVQEL
ncbi:hypothetical protein D3C71_1770920 [compost metagenome]